MRVFFYGKVLLLLVLYWLSLHVSSSRLCNTRQCAQDRQAGRSALLPKTCQRDYPKHGFHFSHFRFWSYVCDFSTSDFAFRHSNFSSFRFANSHFRYLIFQISGFTIAMLWTTGEPFRFPLLPFIFHILDIGVAEFRKTLQDHRRTVPLSTIAISSLRFQISDSQETL